LASGEPVTNSRFAGRRRVALCGLRHACCVISGSRASIATGLRKRRRLARGVLEAPLPQEGQDAPTSVAHIRRFNVRKRTKFLCIRCRSQSDGMPVSKLSQSVRPGIDWASECWASPPQQAAGGWDTSRRRHTSMTHSATQLKATADRNHACHKPKLKAIMPATAAN